MMSQMPLADTCRCVADRFQMVGDGMLFTVKAVIGFGKQYVFVHPDSLWITAGHQGGPGWRANRTGNVETRISAPLSRHSVNVWRLNGPGTEATEVVVPLIVCENDNEVRFFLRGQRRDQVAKQQKKRTTSLGELSLRNQGGKQSGMVLLHLGTLVDRQA